MGAAVGAVMARSVLALALAMAIVVGGCGSDSGSSAGPFEEGGGFGMSSDAGASNRGPGSSSGSSSGGATDGGATDSMSKADAGWGGYDGAGIDAGPDAYVPIEHEKIEGFGAPEGSANFVFIPVKGSDTVVKVSGATLKVSLVEVGDKPTVIRAIPGQDAVAVVNAGSDDLSVLRSTETKDEVTSSPILPHCNRLNLDPTGKYGIAWYDHSLATTDDPTGSFQAVSVVRLGDGATKQESFGVSVGFRPRDVQFDNAGSKAFIITSDGVSVIELAKATDGGVAPPVKITNQTVANAALVEVHVTGDANWALARVPGSKLMNVTHLPSKQIVDVLLPSDATDLDLAPDGSGALAVLPATKHVAWIDLPAAATPVLSVKIATVGFLNAGLARISDDSQTAVLYTSVGGVEQAATLDLKTGLVSAVLLRKTVDYVYLPAGTRKAILVHKPADGPGHKDSTEAFVDDSEGYTLFDLDTGFTKLVLTPFALTRIAVSKAPDKAFLLLPDPKGVEHTVEMVALDTFLRTPIPLGSKPLFAATLPTAKVVAVTQEHPSGRISFVDVDTGKAKTVTGYELNGLVK